MQNISVHVSTAEKRFETLCALVRRTLQLMVRHLGAREVSLDVFLVGDGLMRQSVLAYPHPRTFPRPDREGNFLGELYLNPRAVAREGQTLAAMLAHGLLHLVGYDHRRKIDIMEMERAERRLTTACKTIW